MTLCISGSVLKVKFRSIVLLGFQNKLTTSCLGHLIFLNLLETVICVIQTKIKEHKEKVIFFCLRHDKTGCNFDSC